MGAYERRLRLERAADRLASSSLSLAEIAQGAGFYDQSHFTNEFQRHYGTTPRDYRRTMRPLDAPADPGAGARPGPR